jgi:uncharacterized membrane protein YphA (DoxX/SURF4 family)
VVAALALAVAAVFMAAGLSKLLHVDALRTTLEGLGLPSAPARVLAVAVPVLEIGVALAIPFAVGSPWLGWLVAGLGTAFGLAGAIALRRGERLRCACFGASDAPLGRRQLLLVPVWIAAGAVLGAASVEWTTDARRALLIAAVAVPATIRTAWRLAPEVASAGANRRAIAEHL